MGGRPVDRSGPIGTRGRHARIPLVEYRSGEIDRRTFLRAGGLAAAGIGGAGLLAACGSSARHTLGPSVAPSTSPTTVVDPSLPWWLRGDFAPVAHEVESFDLRVEGTLPKELAGLYVRNGSNPKPGWAPHWFLGDGMVHGVMLGDGKATWYRNRYVRTTLLAAGGGLTAKGAPGGAAGLSNVSVVHHAGRLLTLGEVGFPYELRAEDLSTVGAYDFNGRLAGNMTAHPKIDPATGKMHFFGYNFTEPFLVYHVADRNGALVSSQPVPVKASTMIHDFAITDRDVVFWEMPVLFDMKLAIKMVSESRSRIMPYVWKPEYGSRLGVMPLDGPASSIRWVEIDPCYVFHGMNAWREGDEIVLDVCRMPSVFDAGTALGPPPRLHRWRVDTSGAQLRFRDEVRSDLDADLPSIDRRYAGRAYKHGWRVETRATSDDIVLAGAVHVDAQSGTETRWDPGAQFSSGEWLFVATGPAEAEGVVMTYVYDRAAATSALVVLDARDVGAGPVARITLPQRVPYGFHAAWVPATEV
jgi:carotenoid cleavage dioxygenase-like enzyme